MSLLRVQYFDSQVLGVGDLRVGQSYLSDQLRLHNVNLHAWGIAEGLEVAVDPANPLQVEISSGMAIDGAGREIVLGATASIDFSDRAFGLYYLTLQYGEQTRAPSVPSEDVGPGPVRTRGFTRVRELAVIEASLDPPDNLSLHLVLAAVLHNNNRYLANIDDSVRRPATLSSSEVLFTSPVVSSIEWSAIRGWGQAGSRFGLSFETDLAGVWGDITTSGPLSVGGNPPQASFQVNRISASTGREALPDGVQWRPLAILTQGPDAAVAPALALVSAKLDGDWRTALGLGTTQPDKLLTLISGNLRLDNGTNLCFNGDGTVSNQDGSLALRMAASENQFDLIASAGIALYAGYLGAASATPSLYIPPQRTAEPIWAAGVRTMDGLDQYALNVDGYIATTGGLRFPDGTMQLSSAESASVPVGTVLEWIPPDPNNIVLPYGFRIVSGPQHEPGDPNLENVYVLGVADNSLAGKATGAPSHSHPLTIPDHWHNIDHLHPTLNDLWTDTTSNTDSGKVGLVHNIEFTGTGHQHTISPIPIGMISNIYSQVPSSNQYTVGDHANQPPYVGIYYIYRYA